jgi:hypothetical protein
VRSRAVSWRYKNFLYAFVSTLEVQRLLIHSTVIRFGKNFVGAQAAASVASHVVNHGGTRSSEDDI